MTQNPRTVWVGRDLKEHLIPWAGTPSTDRVAQSSILAWKGGRSELTKSTFSTLFCVHFNNHFSVTCSFYLFPVVSLAKMNLRYFQGVLVFRDSALNHLVKISFLCNVINTKLKALQKLSRYGGMFPSSLIQQEVPLKIILSAVLGRN